jgi:hypothetical protein
MNDRERAKVIKRMKTLVADDSGKVAQIGGTSEVARPLLDQLAELGYHVESLSDLRHLGKPWKTALPTLLSWLPHVDDPGVKEDIIRCLSVPWVGDKATAALIEEFKKSVGTNPPALSWTIGNALSIVDVTGFEAQIIKLCRNPKYGVARQMLVLSLGRLRDPQAEETAVELLNDEEVKLHAIGALGTMKSKRALFELERLLTDTRAVIRKEARKAITKIMR